ncbi:WYL domain-containing protein [Microbacterium sp. ASV49]|uniref:WYL domain-containing protein n=1 Tax=Microbacterium candidum TaxID=3041922 RepID=A0ABT7MYC7_9MICO|nr:WYL domain-containing protein [Microbacterium sp. ASV49]MDL9979448.1 WYL domain-containing protein [Microbacterium sp. ASV49]
MALDAEREARRTLRIDRMQHPVILREGFAEREIPDDALRRLTSRSITTAPYEHRARVRMHASAAEVARIFDPTVATVTADTGGTCILTAGARRPEEFAAYLGMSGLEFEVIEGDAVRTALVEVGERLIRAAARPASMSL